VVVVVVEMVVVEMVVVEMVLVGCRVTSDSRLHEGGGGGGGGDEGGGGAGGVPRLLRLAFARGRWWWCRWGATRLAFAAREVVGVQH
jgi:hypothetical protein